MLTVLDEYTREALSVAVRSKMSTNDVLDALCSLFMNTENLSSYALTMIQSLLQHNFENEPKGLALNHSISIQVVRGKMATTNVSTERYGERS